MPSSGSTSWALSARRALEKHANDGESEDPIFRGLSFERFRRRYELMRSPSSVAESSQRDSRRPGRVLRQACPASSWVASTRPQPFHFQRRAPPNCSAASSAAAKPASG